MNRLTFLCWRFPSFCKGGLRLRHWWRQGGAGFFWMLVVMLLTMVWMVHGLAWTQALLAH